MAEGKEIDESTSTWRINSCTVLPPARKMVPDLTAMETIELLRSSRRLDLEVQDALD